MDLDDDDNSGFVTAQGDDESRSAVNSLVLDYYKKFGRKRDLEQYFSLSTAQTDLRDPTGTFWRKMKSENDSSDSGEKKSESSQEVCRISIRCALPDPPSSSQDEDSKTESESVSPPIITEEVSDKSAQNSDAESHKSDDNHSQKSYDILLDTSMNKPLSPSSSITSQRKLEWDSLADVGYANESDRKTSASSLSTLERLALIQQYSNNDNQSCNIGPPTSHSTPLDENEPKSKTKKDYGKKSTRIYKKDIDLVEVNVPQSSENPTQSINVNLTKHISFNVEKDGKITVENIQKNVSVSPETVTKDFDPFKALTDKEVQTSLLRTKDRPIASEIDVSTAQEEPKSTENSAIKIPVMISLNTLRKKTRRKRMRMARRKLKAKKKSKEMVQEKSVEQLSEAESFEYMPGHIYNQNQLQAKEEIPSNVAGNKSSLESSGVLTTDSSKGSTHSFKKDLEKSIELLRNALRDRCDDSDLRKQLIKQICKRLVNSKYRDDDSTTDFLSGFSFQSKKALETNHTTTSTSDGNDSGDKLNKPKKSILRREKFNAGAIASTSQSAPNLPVAADSEKPVSSKLAYPLLTSNTDSELSSKEKTSSDNVFAKTSSEELYQKYLAAVRREQGYKRHLKDKEMFLKQKLVNSDGACNITPRDAKANSRLQDLIKDLTRNNYDDGSGDASKLEGGPNSNRDFDRFLPIRTQRSHSVFTLSSGNSDYQNKKSNLKKRLQYNLKDFTDAGTSKDHYCCCPQHSNKYGVTDSSVQVNIKAPCDGDSLTERPSRNNSPKRCTNTSPRNCMRRHSPRKDTSPKNTKIVCHCSTKPSKVIDDFLVYKGAKPMTGSDSFSDKCSQQSNKSCASKNRNLPTTSQDCCSKSEEKTKYDCKNMKKSSKSSQTNLLLKMLGLQPNDRHASCFCSDDRNNAHGSKSDNGVKSSPTYTKIYEATRCIQTEISINPKISDPTLSDVNIINDSSCAKLICEGCKETPKTSITDIYSCDLLNQATFSGSSKSTKSSGTSKNVDEIKDELGEVCDIETEKNYESNENTQQCAPIQSRVKTNDDFAIPIQGTNMTLFVCINNERKNVAKTITENATIGTDIIEKNEQATSLIEECSKGVQCDDTASLNRNTNNDSSNIHKIYFMDQLKLNEPSPSSQTSNTYPRSPVDERKPVLRTNTNSANLEREFGEIDVLKDKSNPGSVKSIIPKKCFCGCAKKDCKNKCLEQNASKSCETPRDDKQHIQSKNTTSKTITILDERRKCSCGCGQTDCNDKCFQSNIDVGDGCKKFLENVQKCSCGCDMKDCNNKCIKNDDCVKSLRTKVDCSCGCTKKDCNDKCQKDRGINSVDSIKSKGSKSKECDSEIKGKETVTAIAESSKTKHNLQCSCGCGREGCNEECFKSADHPNSKCAKLKPFDSESANDKCSKPEPKLQCTCGCGVEGCNKKCFNPIENTSLKTSPRDSERKCEEAINATDKCSKTKPTEQCSCGCGREGCNDECFKNSVKANNKDSKDSGNKVTDTVNKCNKDNTKCVCGCGNAKNNCKFKCSELKDSKGSLTGDSKNTAPNDTDQYTGDPILDLIQDITKRYSKRDCEKNKRKKCFKEIMNVLQYLVETDESTDCNDGSKPCESSTPPFITVSKDCDPCAKSAQVVCGAPEQPKTCANKGIQMCCKKSKRRCNESSDMCSTDFPGTSSDSATCKVLNKIKKECDKYHQRRCKCNGRKCDASSSTSVNCDQCRRVHYCNCRSHKCKSKKCNCQLPKKPVAYNLIIQTSDSLVSEDAPCQSRQLKNIVVKVPPKRMVCENIPFKELEAKIGSRMCQTNRPEPKCCRSRSLPNESENSSLEELIRKTQACTVREYLEKNRPDFVENCSQRQDCLKIVSGTRANERAIKRDLLSMRLAQLSDVNEVDPEEIQDLARELGRHLRQKKPQPKLISERDMKKHSEKIYKSLPEVVRKKEQAKKENEKKTNLLMASIFKRNLQKQTLRGSVNLSNYNSVIKI